MPQFWTPAVKRAQHTEVALGVLLAAMLLGLAALIRLHQVTPRGDVTVLAQLSAGAFGTGWPFYVTNLSVTLVLALAANTSFGGLPVLMQLLAKDHRLPHPFTLRAERPVFRYGVATLGALAAAVLLLVGAQTHRLLPVFAIGVFIGFTISQTGLVRHWLQQRGRGWVDKVALNGTGAVLAAVAGVLLFASKFTEGAWLLLLIVPGLMLLFDRIERYYYHVAEQLDLGRVPPKPVPKSSGEAMVIVPVVTISKVAGHALQVAMRLMWSRSPSTQTPTPLTGSASSGNNGTPGLTYGCCPARTAPWWHPPSVSSVPKSRSDASSPSCSPTSNRGADATESCATNAARCSPQQFAHAPTPSSPPFRFAWTEYLPHPLPETGGLPAGVRELCWARHPFSENA